MIKSKSFNKYAKCMEFVRAKNIRWYSIGLMEKGCYLLQYELNFK